MTRSATGEPRIEVNLSTFDATADRLRRAAAAAEEVGVPGIWVMDHLSGQVHATRHTVHECLASLSLVVEGTEAARVGTLAINPASRHPVVAAQALATMADAAAGRLWVGMGAGGGPGTYGDELAWAGLVNHSAAERRARLVETMAVFEHVWSGRRGPHAGPAFAFSGSRGFLRPTPRPPMFVAGYGPRMAELAAPTAGFNTVADHPELEALINRARDRRAELGLDEPFEISTYAVIDDQWLDPDTPQRRRLVAAGVDTLILVIPAPHDVGLIRSLAPQPVRSDG